MLRVRFSNRFETLLDGLLDALADPPSSPFEAQQVIVPSMAVRRKVELALADRFGICANVEFSFLGAWLWRQIARLVEVADVSPFAPAILAWRVFEIFGDRAFVDAHPRLRAYLDEADALMRYELALRVASLFDQYITYRADWLALWGDGESVRDVDHAGANAASDQRWQAALWRRIARDAGTSRRHPASEFLAAIASAARDTLHIAGIPRAAHVFCVPSIPPLYLNMLRHLGRLIDVRVAALNPCREYWLDTVDRRRLSYLAMQGTLDYHEVGNPLLAAWGKARKAQLALLLDESGEAQLDDDRFERNPGKSILARVQNAILDLRDLPPASLADAAPDDRSVEVHVCHSATRELEVLHDYLLALFARRNPPRPSDVLVVTPALDDAAPLIDAVFGTAPRNRFIPYVVTGRGRSRVNHAARALLALLAVAASRFPASAVIELLQQPIIARRFGIDAPALERIRDWIRVAGIRWGIDAKHREQCGVPASARHTFDDGLQRLYLGYALPSGDEAAGAPFDGRLPEGDTQGSDALALGCFSHFMRALERLRLDVGQPKSATGWKQSLLDTAATFLAPDYEQTQDVRDVQAAIGELYADMEAGSARGALAPDVVRAALEAVLDDPARGGVPSGAVTFSAMASLRDLPYRVICIIGANDGAWPANRQPAEFDLIATAPRPGDRQRREDDRNVFLDLLLAARERFYVSYAGRSIRDNTPLPPSVLVSELLDCLVPAIAPPNAASEAVAAARGRLVVEHSLQPFSLDCFTADDPRKRSFNADYCEALRQQLQGMARRRGQEAPGTTPGTHAVAARSDVFDDELMDEDEVLEPLAPFFTAPLALDGDEWRSVTLDQLRRFFRYPCAYLLRARLGIRLDDVEEELCDEEPFVADAAARRALAERLLPLYLHGTGPGEIRALARAGTEYPPGSLGERLLDRELAHLHAFARDLGPALAMPCLPPVDGTMRFAVQDETWQLSGAFGDLRSAGLLRYRYDDTRPVDYLDGWLLHLFLNLLAPPGAALATTWHSRDGQYVLRPVADAKTQMQALLTLYRRGLGVPLHFFPRSAWEYASNGRDLGRAAKKWIGHPPYGGEKDYAAYRLALRGVTDPLDAAFEECASAVFEPLLASIDDPRLE